MKQKSNVQLMTISALLCAIGISIPMFSPVKIILEPASFTLASHVPIFIAMFISPYAAISVALITGFGFLFAGFPIVIVMRALSHLVFAAAGSYMLKKKVKLLSNAKGTVFFGLLMSLIHAVCEVLVVTFFYWGGSINSSKGYLITVIGLVGLGTIIHSMVDYSLALLVWNPLQRIVSVPVSVRRAVR